MHFFIFLFSFIDSVGSEFGLSDSKNATSLRIKDRAVLLHVLDATSSSLFHAIVFAIIVFNGPGSIISHSPSLASAAAEEVRILVLQYPRMLKQSLTLLSLNGAHTTRTSTNASIHTWRNPHYEVVLVPIFLHGLYFLRGKYRVIAALMP